MSRIPRSALPWTTNLLVGIAVVVACIFAASVISALLPARVTILQAQASAVQTTPAKPGQPQGAGQDTQAAGHGTPGTGQSADQPDRFAQERTELESRLDTEQKRLEGEIDKDLAVTKDLQNALLGLTALASLIIGFLTYMSVKFAREDADGQVKLLKEHVAKYAMKIDALEASFPEFGGLDERIRQKLREVELLLPSEADWNDAHSFDRLFEKDKQQILDNEIAISASVSVFALDRSPAMRARLLSIYSAFARFYSARYDATIPPNESDYVRAVSYASRAIELRLPDAVEPYRLRGAIYLSRYDKGAKATPREADTALSGYLTDAEKDLKSAIAKKDPVDGGAYYDMALLYAYRNDLANAVRISRELIDQRDKISRVHREKYLPDTYRNLACFLARQTENASTADKQALSLEVVQTLKNGLETFQVTSNGLVALREAIVDELSDAAKINGKPRPKGELLRLEKDYQDQIKKLLEPPPAAAPQNAATAALPAQAGVVTP